MALTVPLPPSPTSPPSAPSTDAPPPESASEGESKAEQLRREHEELFHELRAVIPGAEVLFAFLLTVAFSQRMDTLTSTQRGVYYGTLLSAGAALVLLLAPSAFHRLRFRKHDKEAMMITATVEAIVALWLISLSIAGAVFLITDILFSTTWAALAAGGIFLLAVTCWWIIPLSRRAAQDTPRDDMPTRYSSGR